MTKFKHTLLAGCAAAVLGVLSGCSATSDDPLEAAPVTLSGVVQIGTAGSFGAAKVSNKPGPLFATDVSGQTFQGAPLSGALVLASDASGNTVSDTGDSTGAFDLTLDSGKAYAVIFIDTKTMNVIGSLVRAADTTDPAAVSLEGDTDLGNVVIDAGTGRAVSSADAAGTLTTASATTMDKDGDGVITNDDVNTMQGEAIASGDATALKKVSVMTFMGDANTWTKEVRDEAMDGDRNWGNIMFLDGGVMSEERLILRRARSVTGPDGNSVTAVKSGSVPIYQNFTGTYKTAEGWDSANNQPIWSAETTTPTEGKGGYFNYTDIQNCEQNNYTNNTWDWCGNLTMYGNPTTLSPFDPMAVFDPDGTGPDPERSLNDYINGWANYTYGDALSGFIYEGDRQPDETTGQLVMKWSQNVPLNIELGAANSFSSTRERLECGGSCYMVEDQTITFTAQMEPTVITDKFGNKLPVMYIDADVSVTLSVYTDDTKTTLSTDAGFISNMPGGANPATMNMNEAFYLVGKYGAEFPALDSAGAKVDMATQFAASKIRFGLVSPEKGFTVSSTEHTKWNTVCGLADGTYTDTKVCDTTPATIGSATVAADALATARDSWLVALAGHIDEIDKPRMDNNNGEASAYFWVEHNADGQALEPIGWDPATYMQTPLISGTAKDFTTTLAPDATDGETNAANYNVHFNPGAIALTNLEFYLEARTHDPAAENPHDSDFTGFDVPVMSGGAPVRGAVVAGDVLTSGMSPNYGEYVVSLTGSLTLPEVPVDSAATGSTYKDRWSWWQETTPGTWEPYCSAPVTIWAVMRDKSAGAGNEVVVMEQPVGWYNVINSTKMADTETCSNQ